jgi:precorrin-2 dehydrogenase/sirohydrochlorin ferrochelatase
LPVDRPAYPVNLLPAGRRCVVVGAGPVAATKIEGLLDADADVVVVAPRVSDAVRSLADRITLVERPYRDDDLDGAWLAIAATDDPEVNRRVHDDGEARRVWVNSADDPDNCTFTLPARVRQGPLLVTFSTGGASPAVASWLRRRYAEEFGPEYATLVEMLAAERTRIRAEGGEVAGLDWHAALDSGMLDLIREGNLAEAKERLQACLSSSSD